MAASKRRRAPRPTALLLLLAPLIVAGCEAGSADTGHVVTDSAGIRIVTSSRPVWTDDGWRVAEEPVLDVGLREGDDDYLLNRVADVIRLDDGGIVLSNNGDNSVRRYDAEGVLGWKAGRTGGGPGEYQAVDWLRRIGDTLLALETVPTQPNHLYDLHGRQIGEVRPTDALAGRSLGVFAVFADGSYLYGSAPSGRPPKGERWVDSTSLFRVSTDGARLDSLGRMPIWEYARVNPQRGDWVVFAPQLQVAAGAGLYFANYPEDCDIEAYDLTGALVRRIRWQCVAEPVPAEDIERYRHDFLYGPPERPAPPMPDQIRAVREALLASRVFAENYPTHGEIRIDLMGNLWVQRRLYRTGGTVGSRYPVYPEPTEWLVFDAEGVWLGVVNTPARFAVREIGADYVAGIWRDEFDIEHARVYRLIKD